MPNSEVKFRLGKNNYEQNWHKLFMKGWIPEKMYPANRSRSFRKLGMGGK